MTDRETMQQALEALETKGEHHPRVYAAITVLREALAQPEQEPDRRALQAAGIHPAPCARHCEAKAFGIEIRSLKSALRTALAASDTNIITAAFEATVFYETVEQALKERNHE